MAAQEKNMQEVEKAKKLSHVPWCDEYEKMISGMLYVYLLHSYHSSTLSNDLAYALDV
jgi:hypothetical protein